MYMIFLAVSALFIALGIVFASGKGAGLIAGYNTASPEEKAGTDEKKLLKAMSVFMFVLAGCFVISALCDIFNVRFLVWIGQALFVISLIVGIIYINKKDRFKK